LRELQAKTLHSRIASVAGTAPVVIGGDFNLVGSPRPLEILGNGLDHGGADLMTVPARRLGDRSQVTWRDLELGSFTPGRLDFILFPTAFFELDRSFVFDTEELPESLLAEQGLEVGDSRIANHLVSVADLRPRLP
jgi:hypothetical protein